MLRSLRPWANRALEKLGFRFFTKPQRYEVVYEVRLKSRTSDTQRVAVALPVPPETLSQTITDHQLDPNMEIKVEPLYGNAYASWEGSVSDRPVVLRQTFAASVKPQSAEVDPSGDYPTDLFRIYTQANRFIQPEGEIATLAKRIVGTSREIEALEKINAFLLKKLTYGNPIPGLYSAKEAMEKPLVDCGGYDALYCSLAIAVGIPSRVVSGFWAGYETGEMHAWAESALPGPTWIPVDPSVEQLYNLGRTSKSGRFNDLGSDRIVFSYGCDYPLEIGDKTVQCDILQHPLVVTERGNPTVDVELKVTTKCL